MKRSTKLRLFGGLVLLFNIWLVGRYDLQGTSVLLLTFGFAIGYELLVVRLVTAGNDKVGPVHSSAQETLQPAAKQEKIGLILHAGDGRTVVSVSNGSPADRAGLVVGDQVFAIGDELCGIKGEANAKKIANTPGSTVRLGVWRDGSAHSLNVTRSEV